MFAVFEYCPIFDEFPPSGLVEYEKELFQFFEDGLKTLPYFVCLKTP